jgi:predicted secreted protein
VCRPRGAPRLVAVMLALVRRVRAMLAAAAVVAVAVVATGCGGDNGMGVPVGAGSASIGKGDTLRVDLGKANPSIGDSWHLVTPPDPAVLSDQGDEFDADCDDPGCDGRIRWTFLATGPGTTSLVFRYCYRSDVANCVAEPTRGPDEPVTLTVTVR